MTLYTIKYKPVELGECHEVFHQFRQIAKGEAVDDELTSEEARFLADEENKLQARFEIRR